MKMQQLAMAALIAFGATGCASLGIGKSVTLPPGSVLLDVRRVDEYQARPVEKAVLIPHLEIESRIGEAVPCKTTPVYVYCRSGKRAGIAIEKMKKLGYTDLTNLGGVEDVINTVTDVDE